MSHNEKNSLPVGQYSHLKSYAQELLDIYGSEGIAFRLLNKGVCMSPIVEKGDWLEVLPNVQEYHIGDIVVLRIQGELVVHRIVDISRRRGEESFVTKGDITSKCDEAIDRSALYGKVVVISKANSDHKIDCTKLSTLFFIIARLSFKSARLCQFVHYSHHKGSSVCRMSLGVAWTWTKVLHVLIRTATRLHSLK